MKGRQIKGFSYAIFLFNRLGKKQFILWMNIVSSFNSIHKLIKNHFRNTVNLLSTRKTC